MTTEGSCIVEVTRVTRATFVPVALIVLFCTMPAAYSQKTFSGKGDKQSWARAQSIADEAGALNDAGKTDAALEKYKQAIAIYPFDAELFLEYGDLLSVKKDLKGALTQFKKAVKLDPKNFDATEALAETSFDLHDLKTSEDAYKQALALKPNNSDIVFNIIKVLIDENKFAEASSFLEKGRAAGLKPEQLERFAETIKKKKVFYPDAK